MYWSVWFSPASCRQPSARNAKRGAALLAGLACLTNVAAAPISVRTVTLGDVVEVPVYSAPADVVARNQPKLAAEIDARVVALPRAVGERVVAGDLLARLDCRRHESSLATARAEFARSRAQQRYATEQLARARNLQRNKSISEELLDQRTTDLAAAEAEARVREEAQRRAAIDVENCELRSPFDAVVTARHASVGSFVTRGSAVIELLETSGQEVSVALRHDQVAGAEAAAGLQFESNGTAYPVRLRALLPIADSIARTREARLEFLDQSAIAGSAGRLVWRGEGALLPADYLVRRNGVLGVFMADGGTARFTPVPAAEDGRPALVTLPPDTHLISDGRQRLNDGDEIVLVPAAEPR
ncbi:MAG: efflux RND transporter periplasmic adaptor subunit [Chromatiaceae bacterium]|nr:efflux RND transporter periplasmic adaptor subunit [Chromatiaceae bacterium]